MVNLLGRSGLVTLGKRHSGRGEDCELGCVSAHGEVSDHVFYSENGNGEVSGHVFYSENGEGDHLLRSESCLSPLLVD